MTNVFLYGKLGDLFGTEFKFNLRSPREVFAAINANRRGFTNTLKQHVTKGIMYRIVVDDGVIADPKELEIAKPPSEIHIVPVIWGSGKNAGMAIAMIALAIATWGGSLYLQSAGYSAQLVSGIQMVAISFAISGVMMLLFPPPKANFDQETSAGAKSYMFGGTLNSEKQGGPVPVGYGRLLVGSTVISSQLRNYDLGSDIRSLFTPASKPTVIVPTVTSTELSFAKKDSLVTTFAVASNNYIDIRSNLAVDSYSGKVSISIFSEGVDVSDNYTYTWRVLSTTTPSKFFLHNAIEGHAGMAYGDQFAVTQYGFANDPRIVTFRGANSGGASTFILATYICEGVENTTGKRVVSPSVRVGFSWFGGSVLTEESADTNTSLPSSSAPPPESWSPPPPNEYVPPGYEIP